MTTATRSTPPRRVLFVGHEASRTGAPIGFLRLMRWLRDEGEAEGAVWLRSGGPLVEAHEELGPVAVGTDLTRLADSGQGFQLAYLNTATLGAQAEALKACGMPVICHVHEMDFELGVTSIANRERLRRTVDRFVACSEATRDGLVRTMGIRREQVVVVPECVDTGHVLRSARETASVGLRHPDRKWVAGMGVVSWRKGVDLFLQVCADLAAANPAWHGLWIGDLDSGPDAARVRHDLRLLGLEDRVRFTGSLANPHSVLAQADVFCLTSREDPYPLAMVEAAILGKPVVGFAGSGGVEEFCGEAGGRIVGYGDTRGMADAVRDLAGGEERPGQGLAAARALCDPAAVGPLIAGLVRETALGQPIEWTPSRTEFLAPAGGEQVGIAVTADFGGQRLTADWEVPAQGAGEVHFSFDSPFSGPLVITLEPTSRNVVVEGLEVDWMGVDGMEATVIPATKAAGRSVKLRKDPAPAWALLEGRGRLLLDIGEVPPLYALTVRWHSDTDIKQQLRSALESTVPARRGILQLLPAGFPRDTSGSPARKTAGRPAPSPQSSVNALWS